MVGLSFLFMLVFSSEQKYGALYEVEGVSLNLHLISVRISVENTEGSSYIDFRLPAWRPGRYQIQNYAANVQEFFAFGDSEKDALRFEKVDKQTWRVRSASKGKVAVRYKYYAGDNIDAGNCYFGWEELYINGSNLFMYADQSRDRPALLKVNVPSGWRVATQLTPVSKQTTFSALTYDALIDSPILASPTLTHDTVSVRDVAVHISFASQKGLDGKEFNVQNIKRDVSKIVESQFAIMGTKPVSSYWFIYHVVPHRIWHGVEHAHSASIVVGPVLDMDKSYDKFLSITSHEFFHLWNVKRLVPREYARYDYTKESYSRLLYVSEGFTSYYGDLALLRSGLISLESYLAGLSKTYTTIKTSEGAKVQTLAESSFDAWLSGYGRGRMQSTVSFYDKGELVGLMLDMEIRKRTNNRVSLDDVMRNMFDAFSGSAQGFSELDFEQVLEKVSGSSFKHFLDEYVYSLKEIELSPFLEHVGLSVKNTASAYFGAVLDDGGEFPVVQSIIPNSPAHKFGLDSKDVLVAVDGVSLMRSAFSLSLHKPKQKIDLSVIRGEALISVKVTLGEQSTYAIVKRDKLSSFEAQSRKLWAGLEL